MAQDKVTRNGRIRYVDPNDFVSNSFNTIHPHEDYSIYVDLVVNVPNRYGSAQNNNGDEIILGSYNAGKTSFFGGTNGFMTDKPSSITYSDIMNGESEGVNESLGITNIHISYNSYFYPTVTIQFSDVRGSALMGSHEENYRRSEINKAKGEQVYSEKVASFFSALFSFPYPEFKLRVKGFYGKKVEFSLLVSNFKSSFNNNTGNFDCTVDFVGKMYGVYTDIPMSYLLIAPYCRYGSENNKTIWDSKNYVFEFDKQTPIPKFLDLQELILKANNELPKNIDKNVSENYTKLKKKLEKLNEINSNLNALMIFFEKNELKDNKVFIEKESVIYFHYLGENEKCNYLYPKQNTNDFNKLQNHLTNLYESLNAYNNEFSTELPRLYDLAGVWNVNDIIGKVVEDRIVKIDDKGNITFPNNDKNFKENFEFGESINDYQTGNFFKGKKICYSKEYFVLSCKQLRKKLKELINDINTDLSKNEDKLKEVSHNYISSVLKFEPTIKNIFNILMAHLECFMTIYHSLIQNISGVNSRTLGDFGFTQNQLSDMPDNNVKSSNSNIPPFPGLKNNENTYCYPTSLNLNKEMEEAKLIDALFEGSFDFSKGIDSLKKLSEGYYSDTIEFIPTCLSDFTLRDNPYNYTFNNNSGDIDVDWILTFFGLRCIIKYILEKGEINNFTPETFGKLEAYNFWRKNTNLRKDIINKINTSEFNDNAFTTFLSNPENSRYSSNNTPCYKNENVKRLLLFQNGRYELPKDYNFPALIGRDNNGISQFHKDTKDDAGIYSFKNDNTIPYGVIDIINDSYLDNWNNSLNSFDVSDYCENSQKPLIIENYTIPSKEMFKKTPENRGYMFDIRYRKNNITDFIREYHELSSYKNDGLIYLNEAYDNQFKDGSLDSIVNHSNGVSFFLSDDMNYVNAENFLLSIPHNWEKIAKDISDGKTILTLPYSTRLTIGLIINKISTTNEKKDLIDFVNKIRLDYFNIIKTVCCLTRNASGEIWYGYLNEEYTPIKVTGEHYEILFNNREYFAIDCLGFSDEYVKWAASCEPGGFEYFKQHYSLTDVDIDGEDVKYLWPYTEEFGNKPTSTNERLLKAMRYYKNKEGGNFQEYMNEKGKEILNTSFKEVYGSKKTKNPFTDRYSYVSFINENNMILSDNFKIFLSFNKTFIAYEPLCNFFKRTDKLVIPYQIKKSATTIYGNIKTHQHDRFIDGDTLRASFNAFKRKLLELYEVIDKETNTIKNDDFKSLTTISEDKKLSTYMTLKNLYDKHLSTINKDIEELYTIKNPESEFKRFHFIDTFYTDISNKLYFNVDIMYDIIDNIINNKDENGIINNEMSVYSFMSLICEKHHTMLLAVPIFNWYEKDCVEGLNRMFTPLTFNECSNEPPLVGPSYICFYPHQASYHLENENCQYKNDGFNLVDINDTGNFEGPLTIPELNNTTYDEETIVIPAFGVEYGTQKQSIFKNINVNMDNPQTTEVAVATMFDIAKQNGKDARKLTFEGQDLYKIYSNYSFTCQVEMMGCAQIQPLMYFQLNNIPMFRGAYQIIQVEHNITPGDMTTSFKGVRINRTKLPMVTSGISSADIKDKIGNYSTTQENKIIEDMNIQKLGKTNIGLMDTKLDVTSDYLINNFPEHIKFDSGQKGKFNGLNPELRKLILCIVSDAKELSKKLGYNLGITVASTTRNNDNASLTSDHNIDPKATPSERRKVLGYEKLGCAIDIHGNRNGNIDRGEASINIFSLIANTYHDYCRQLIWEHDVPGDRIRVIHLASYGKIGEGSDKIQIFHGTYPSGKNTGSKNLPSEFIAIAKDIVDKNIDNYVKLINFGGKTPTADELKTMYNNAKGILA